MHNNIKNLFLLSVIWVLIVIITLMLFFRFLSYYFNELGENYLSSIFSIVFAGLITGFVLTILSGIKSVYVTYLKERLNWLEKRVLVNEIVNKIQIISNLNHSILKDIGIHKIKIASSKKSIIQQEDSICLKIKNSILFHNAI